MSNRARLTCNAATGDGDADVELARHLQHFERLAHDHAAGLAAEELIERPVIDDDLAVTGLQVNTRGGGLSAAGAVLAGCWHVRVRPLQISSGFGCCAWCGCVPPANTCSL